MLSVHAGVDLHVEPGKDRITGFRNHNSHDLKYEIVRKSESDL